MAPAKDKIKLSEIPLGGRILFRSKKDWRTAVVARITEDSITLSIASPTGYNYRVRRDCECELGTDGPIPFLITDNAEAWKENFSIYDRRW